MIKMKNIPDCVKSYTWTVGCVMDGELWYYSVANDESKAFKTAAEVNGIVVLSSLIMD